MTQRKKTGYNSLLLGVDALNFLEHHGLPVLPTEFARDEDEAVQVAKKIGFPLVVKVSSQKIIHKTDIGGVRTGIRTEEELKNAINAFIENIRDQHIEGFIIQKEAKGIELIVGTLLDKHFGQVIMFGLGGIMTEIFKDVSFRLIPLDKRDVEEMIRETRVYDMIKEARGESLDINLLKNFLLQVGKVVEGHIEEMDINPLFLGENGPLICDSRIKLNSEVENYS